MSRSPSFRWNNSAKRWNSDVGENGRRKPVYIRETPYGAKGNSNFRKAQDELKKYLGARDARKQRRVDHTLGDLSRLYLLWLKARVEAGRNRPLTNLSALKALKKFRSLKITPGRLTRDKVSSELTATDLARIVACLQAVLN